MTEPIERPTCATCRHWKPRYPGEEFIGGECRRNPPVASDRVGYGGGWPKSEHTDWCGEHAPAPETKAVG